MTPAELHEWLLARLREVMPMCVVSEVEFKNTPDVPLGTVRVTVETGCVIAEPAKPDRDAQRRAILLKEMGRPMAKEK